MRQTAFIGVVFFLSSIAMASSTIPTLEFGVGSNVSQFNYKELCSPSDQENTGIYGSTLGNVKYHLPGMLTYIEAEYETASVSSKYSGATIATSQPVISTNGLKFVDYAVKLNLALTDNVFLYAGFGHHTWTRNLENSYSEKYQWDVTPVGLLAWYSKSDTVDLGIDLGLLPMANSTIHIDTSDFVAGGMDNDAKLGNKTGFKVKLPIVWHFGSMNLETTPWFQHTEIGQSDAFVNTTIFTSSPYLGDEPNSETYLWGLEVLASVQF